MKATATMAVALTITIVAFGCGGAADTAAPGEVVGVTDGGVGQTSAPTDSAVPTTSTPEPTADFLDLHYHGTYFDGEMSMTPLDECDASASGTLVCDFELVQKTFASHIGVADDRLVGTVEISASETCPLPDGQTGTPSVADAAGRYLTAWGDEVHYRSRTHNCSIGLDDLWNFTYWEVTGGTGRFEGAHGTFSNANAPDHQAVSVGTLRVRADLWDWAFPAASFD